jgi:hypothetical protein
MDIHLETPSMWLFINPNVKGSLGYPTGYEIMPGATVKSFMSPDDLPQKRVNPIEDGLSHSETMMSSFFARFRPINVSALSEARVHEGSVPEHGGPARLR